MIILTREFCLFVSVECVCMCVCVCVGGGGGGGGGGGERGGEGGEMGAWVEGRSLATLHPKSEV